MKTLNYSLLEIFRVLRSHEIVPTRQRADIFNVLFAKQQHLSADKIISRVKKIDAHISRATVYNTLGLFSDKGIIRKIIVDPTKIFYDSTTIPHHHFYNLDDGTLVNVSTDHINLQKLPTPPAGTILDGVDIVIRIRRKTSLDNIDPEKTLT